MINKCNLYLNITYKDVMWAEHGFDDDTNSEYFNIKLLNGITILIDDSNDNFKSIKNVIKQFTRYHYLVKSNWMKPEDAQKQVEEEFEEENGLV